MDITIRKAQRDDLVHIVRLLADDEIGSTREDTGSPLPSCYLDAYRAICADPCSSLLVACEQGRVVGCLQLSFLWCLSHRGAKRAVVENVRVARDKRCQGIGTHLVRFAIARAKEQGAAVVQLMTDRRRTRARQFYRRLGFQETHVGLKFTL